MIWFLFLVGALDRGDERRSYGRRPTAQGTLERIREAVGRNEPSTQTGEASLALM